MFVQVVILQYACRPRTIPLRPSRRPFTRFSPLRFFFPLSSSFPFLLVFFLLSFHAFASWFLLLLLFAGLEVIPSPSSSSPAAGFADITISPGIVLHCNSSLA